jgi:hypothetical protein
MATLYFYAGGSGGAWDNSSNWYEDIDHLISYNNVPTSADDVILLDNVNGSMSAVYCNTITTGSYVFDVGSTSTTVTSQALFQSGFTYAGTITCPDVVFSNGATHNGSIIGNASFYNSSYMGVGGGGNVSGTVSFYDTSYFYDATGITTWPTSISFNGSSYCEDSISASISSITFNNSSYNKAISTLTISGNVVFNNTSQNLGIITNVAIFNGSSLNGDGMMMGASIGDGSIFNGSSIHKDLATVNGDASFNDTSYCYGDVSGTATFSQSAAVNMLDNEAIPGTIGSVMIKGGGINGSSILGIL